ncbi:ABC transporter ATP-binding protein [Neptunomonas japonica]|uniref:ABC transporter ATP-binding protein n=1 Tax=Neptunomonas japonica TaxID=417574 RepID=UPI000405976F|nr:ABC transporter ATP-binding protein [Neptunomonas japonica]
MNAFSSNAESNREVPVYNWQYIRSIALEHKRDLVVANLIAVFAAAALVPLPLLMPLLVDEVLLNQPAKMVALVNGSTPQNWHGPLLYVGAILLLTLSLRLVALLLNVWQARKFTLIAKEVTYRMRSAMLQQLQRISMAEYENLGSGSVNAHFVTDLDTVDKFIGSTVSRLLVAILSVLGTAFILLWIHWQLALFILLMNPLVIYATRLVGKRVKHLKTKENKAYELFQGLLTETLDGIQQLRAANREKHYIDELRGSAKQVRDNAAAFAWKSDAAGRFSFSLFLLGFELFRAVAMLMVVFSDLSVGEMMAVFGYLWFMMGPVQEILGIQYSWYGAKAALARINRLMSLTQEPYYPPYKDPFRDRNTVSIELRDIHFAYQADKPILNGISLKIPEGQTVALVGASGGGKSTLVQVLLGLYPVSLGQVAYAGVPVQEIGYQQVRENVVTVLQHPALFNGSIRSNLGMGREFEEDKLWKALDIAQLKEFVQGLEQQLDTAVGRSGVRLSGGQRQRLAIARMVLSDPKVVILDEATSALDMETEQKLHSALSTFLCGRTTLIVAHRLSAVKQADHVYVFDGGYIAEQGSHEALIGADGYYASLYSKAV